MNSGATIAMRPACVTTITTSSRSAMVPRWRRNWLNSVDERFAWDEGEGERTRDWWLSAHRRFFGRRAAAQGFQMHDEIETMFERFEVVWPPEIADRRKPL